MRGRGLEEVGGVDVLVNDAGTGHPTPLLGLDLGTWREVLATDLDGACRCLERAARRMAAAGRGGPIVSITSVHEHVPRPGFALYAAAKFLRLKPPLSLCNTLTCAT